MERKPEVVLVNRREFDMIFSSVKGKVLGYFNDQRYAMLQMFITSLRWELGKLPPGALAAVEIRDFSSVFSSPVIKFLKPKEGDEDNIPIIFRNEKYYLVTEVPYLVYDTRIDEVKAVLVEFKANMAYVLMHELLHMVLGHCDLGDKIRMLEDKVRYNIFEIAVEYQVDLFCRTIAERNLYVKENLFEPEEVRSFHIDIVHKFLPEYSADLEMALRKSVVEIYRELGRKFSEDEKFRSYLDRIRRITDVIESEEVEQQNKKIALEDIIKALLSRSVRESEKEFLRKVKEGIYIPIHLDLSKEERSTRAVDEGPFSERKQSSPGIVKGIGKSILGRMSADIKELDPDNIHSIFDVIPWYIKAVTGINEVWQRKINLNEPSPEETLWQHKILSPKIEPQYAKVAVAIDTSGSMPLEEIEEGLKYLASLQDIIITKILLHHVHCYFYEEVVDMDEMLEKIRKNYEGGGTDYWDLFRKIEEYCECDEIILHITDGICSTSIPEELKMRYVMVSTYSGNCYKNEKDLVIVDISNNILPFTEI